MHFIFACFSRQTCDGGYNWIYAFAKTFGSEKKDVFEVKADEAKTVAKIVSHGSRNAMTYLTLDCCEKHY